jgi:ABC-2 type transport system permease protein
MIPHQYALIQREIWEHRSIWLTPLIVALVMSLMLLAGYTFATAYDDLINLGIVGAQNAVAEEHRRAALTAFFMGPTSVFVFASAILTIFYCLDALYTERKNKSILFWRSMPVTDAETVLSKLLTAVLAIPMVTYVVLMAANVLNLILMSIFVGIEGGSPTTMIWQSAPALLFDVGASMFLMLLMLPIWFSPFIGWFLFVSAWTRRSPLLTAFLPLIVLPTLETIILPTHLLWDAIATRFNNWPMFTGIDPETFFDEDKLATMDIDFGLLDFVDIGKFLTSPAMWAGVIVCALFVTAAIYVRRYRDES